VSLLVDVDFQRGSFGLQVTTAIPGDGFTAIYGHSGAGKTSLLRWIAGLEKTNHGELHFHNTIWQDRHTLIPTHLRQIAFVFQEPRLFPHLNTLDNLLYARKRRFSNNGPSLEQVCQWLGLQHLLAHYPQQLSGGQQQRVAIARALLSNPKLLLMDEPLGALDHKSKQVILKHLQKLRQHIDIPILYVSHDIEEISQLANHLLILEGGKLIEQGTMVDLCNRLDLNLSHEENAASIISGLIERHDERYGLTELMIDKKHSLLLAKKPGEPGSRIAVRIPARDVSIALSPAVDSSILNILPCTVDAIEESGDSRMLVRLKLEQQYLLARLTHKSVDRLSLSTGQQVYAQIKTVALLSEEYTDE